MIQSRRWRDLRLRKLRACPLCEECLAAGRTRLAGEVHHVEPVEWGGSPAAMERLMFDEANLRSVCPACHDELHRRLGSHSREAVRRVNEQRTASFVERYLGNE